VAGNPFYRTLKELYLLALDWLLRQASEDEDLSPAERQRPGRNLALSPGKVVYRNRLIELIQYEPKGETVHQVPLLILPPWINKYYLLDLQPKNSMVRYLVEQGFTVFMVSWRNPDPSMEGTTIEDYVDLGPLAASDVVREITGSPTVNVVGYCIAGTLLAMTLAWLAAEGDERFGAVTFMVSMQDFSKVGDTAVFLGEQTVDFIEQQMLERGYLDSRELSNMFSLLRSNDLIWANVVNNYLLGQKPPAFDLLYWNSDGTRMARAAHGWYLRNTYVENNLVQPGKVRLKGEALDLGCIRQDIYAVGAEKVPWDAAFASPSSRAARCASSSRRAATSPASSTRLVAKAPIGRTRTARPTRPSGGARTPNATTGAGGRTGSPGSPRTPARRSSRRPWVARHTRPCRMHPGATCWRNSAVFGLECFGKRKRRSKPQSVS
jgi:Poly-beta-hydroxybutyrate polymerase (PhaC) N-terminus